MPVSQCQLVTIACFTLGLLVMHAATSPEVRQKRSDDAGPLEDVVEQLSQQVTSFAAQLNAVNAEVAALKTKTATLDKTVVFQAWNDHNPVVVAPHCIVVLSDVAINVGSAYSNFTGTFTVPISGIYNFQATVMSDKRGQDQFLFCGIYVDDNIVATAASDSEHGYLDQATMNYIGHLNAGQKVFLKNSHGTATSYYHGWPGNPYTSFSGFLVKAD